MDDLETARGILIAAVISAGLWAAMWLVLA